MRRWAAFVPIALLVGLVAIAAFVLLRGGDRETISSGEPQRMAPVYALARLENGEIASSDAFRGRAHVINLWASWCVPCRAEHAELMALKQRGVAIVGVAYKDRPENSTAFLTALGNPFETVLLDPDGRFGLELGVTGVPETFVIGADGRIRAIVRGPLTDEIVTRQVLPALGS